MQHSAGHSRSKSIVSRQPHCHEIQLPALAKIVGSPRLNAGHSEAKPRLNRRPGQIETHRFSPAVTLRSPICRRRPKYHEPQAATLAKIVRSPG
jgi:hypothetical protein